jgi:hypothetical protein
MAAPFLVASYFTPAYAAEAAGLVESLRALGLPHEVCPVASRGGWDANCCHKPAFLRDIRERNPGTPLVWLDADARCLRRPSLFDAPDCDFAAHFFRDWELISACLYFAPTAAADALLADWAAACAARPWVGDQPLLAACVRRAGDGLRVLRLPPSYNWIQAGDGPDLSEQAYGPRDDIVVRQRQASRRLKRLEGLTA